MSLTSLKTVGLKIAKLKVAESDTWAPSWLHFAFWICCVHPFPVTSKTVVPHETTAGWSNLSIFRFHCVWNSALISVQLSPLKSCVWQTSTTLPHASGDPLQSSWFLKSWLHCVEFWGAMEWEQTKGLYVSNYVHFVNVKCMNIWLNPAWYVPKNQGMGVFTWYPVVRTDLGQSSLL